VWTQHRDAEDVQALANENAIFIVTHWALAEAKYLALIFYITEFIFILEDPFDK